MKRLFLFTCLCLLCGCAAQIYPTMNHNVTQTQVVLDKANFKIIGRAEGVASATYILGIGGLSEDSLKGNAVDDMYRTANLKGSQAIININFKYSIISIPGAPGIFDKVEYRASGTIIEFMKDDEEVDLSNRIVNIDNADELYAAKVPGDEKNIIKIGSIIDYNGIAAMVCQVRGTDVVLTTGGESNGTWEEAIMYCEKLEGKWRLPSVDEFKNIKLQLFYAGNNKVDGFWTREEVRDKQAYYFDTMHKTEFSALKIRKYHIVAITSVNINDLNRSFNTED